MKNLYSKSLMAAVAVMMLASCSNEEPGTDGLISGKTTKVAISMSLSQGKTTKATQDEVNMGDDIQDINNVIIVPYIGNVAQNIISLGTFKEKEKTTHYKQATIAQKVNKFRVYGNLPGAYADNASFVFPDLTLQEINGEYDFSGASGFMKPYGLYYYTEAVASSSDSDNRFEIASTGTNWETASYSPATTEVGTSTFVKINKVKYPVGVLAAAVINGVAAESANDTKKIFSDDGSTASLSLKDLRDAGTANPFKIAGIVIEGQPKNLDATFKPVGADEVKVYEEATKKDLSAASLDFDSSNKIKNANIYCVVAPEDADNIIVNFRFQNVSGKHLHLNDGTVADPNAYFYLYATLRANESNKIFDAATSTLLNATVQDWGRGTTEIVETTDVAIGIVIDASWARGIKFDENI